MTENLIKKIKTIVAKKENVDENQIRSLMVLIRQVLDNMSQSEQDNFLTLRLFCTWTMHIKIDQSNTGLRILAKINDTLVSIKNSTDQMKIRTKMSNAISFSILRKDLNLFFKKINIDDVLTSPNKTWVKFIDNLIEIISDVPLAFPPLSQLDKTKQKIYNQIAKKPIKPGAGVISVKISLIKYPPPTNEIKCLIVKTEDTTSLIIPLIIDVRL